jgi:hypothetical protein
VTRDATVPGLTGWINTDALLMECSNCGAKPHDPCRMPSWRKSAAPHSERTRALIAKYGRAPFTLTPKEKEQA